MGNAATKLDGGKAAAPVSKPDATATVGKRGQEANHFLKTCILWSMSVFQVYCADIFGDGTFRLAFNAC